jgi:hypothetical protein
MLLSGAMNGLGSVNPEELAEEDWYVRNGDVGDGVGKGR